MHPPKRVLLIVIDGLGAKLLEECFARDVMPTLRAIADRGTCSLASPTVFPSITPTATSSILTGVYPARHGLMGMLWYLPGEDRVVHYGGHYQEIVKLGLVQGFKDMLEEMNLRHLEPGAKTIHERLSATMRTASINYLVYRDRYRHAFTLPGLKHLLGRPGKNGETRGPYYHFLGNFLRAAGDGQAKIPLRLRYAKGLGFHDANATALARWLVDQEDARFVLLYSADTDHVQHNLPMEKAFAVLERLDRRLRDVLVRKGGTLEQALEEFVVVVTADHGHDQVSRWLPLERHLSRFSIVEGDEGLRSSGKDLLVAGNGRMAAITLAERPGLKDAVMQDLRGVEGVDLVLTRDVDWFEAHRAGAAFRFRRCVAGGVVDPYGNRWECAGDPGTLDLTPQANVIAFGAYPNALERIEGYFITDRAADVAVSLAPTFDLQDSSGGHQKYGDHGSLHETDSVVPVITSEPLRFGGSPPRTIDVAPAIVQYLLQSLSAAANG